MLTLDLLRYKVTEDTVSPVYLTLTGGRKYLNAAERILSAYRSAVGKSLGELESALDEELGASPDYKVHRGLAKIASEYAAIGALYDGNAEELRRLVFTRAADEGPMVRTSDLLYHKTARDKLGEIAEELGMGARELADALYADLKENQVIRQFDTSLTAVRLIQRYNTALAQAMLYRASRMIVDIYDGYRGVFKHIKLARLMHSIKPMDDGYRIEIDGPLSLFSNVERYGIGMARVLPAILQCKKWRLAAKVNLQGEGEKLFRLSSAAGLTSHYRGEPEFDSSPEEAFYTKFQRNSKSKWEIKREGSILDLKETVLIPDFRFTHSNGTVVHLEIVGYWTPEYLAKKLDKLSRVRDANVLVAAPTSLACAEEDMPAKMIRYKSRLLIKDVLPALESFLSP